MENTLLTVSDFVCLINQTLDYAYPIVTIEGEVSSFKTNQNKYIFFDIKDDENSVGCFMMLWQLRMPIEDGMKVIIKGAPKLTKWGKFSLTVSSIKPVGEGSIKKSFDLLKEKLTKEGLFAVERKRQIPKIPSYIGLIASTQSAGYADFVKILDERWSGVLIDVAHVQVQGDDSPKQIINAIDYFNSQETLPEILVIIRGGGSKDDLSVFNDEPLVRKVASSRIPTVVGVGHEIDTSLADMAADVRASTPSNAAQLIVPDKISVKKSIDEKILLVRNNLSNNVLMKRSEISSKLDVAIVKIEKSVEEYSSNLAMLSGIISQLNPNNVLKRGYAIVRGKIEKGYNIKVELIDKIVTAKVGDVYDKKTDDTTKNR
jgi:exodeoxyribonuclease VII large subunit